MSFTSNHIEVRAVINQVVNDPTYKEVSKIPLFSFPQIGLTFLAYALVLGGLYLAYLDYSLWIVYPLMVFGFFTSFTPLHDATHRSVSSNKYLNDFIGTLSGTLLFPFNNTTMYRYVHLSHHRNVGDHILDPDEAMVGVPTKYFPFGYLIFFIYDYVVVYWLFTKVWNRTPDKTRLLIIGTVGANLLFSVVLLASPYWYEFLIWFVIPNRLAVAYTNYTFSYLPHPEGVYIHEHPFKSTFTLTGPKAILKTFWGQADHAMHHFLPHIPWYKYHKVWNLANGIFHQQGIPTRSIFSGPLKDYKENLHLKNTEVNVRSAKSTSKAFQLILNKTNKTLRVEKDLTIIDTLMLNNIQPEYSCLQGTCGTCITEVLEGEIDHRDSVLSDQEKKAGNKMCICVSRAKGATITLKL